MCFGIPDKYQLLRLLYTSASRTRAKIVAFRAILAAIATYINSASECRYEIVRLSSRENLNLPCIVNERFILSRLYRTSSVNFNISGDNTFARVSGRIEDRSHLYARCICRGRRDTGYRDKNLFKGKDVDLYLAVESRRFIERFLNGNYLMALS